MARKRKVSEEEEAFVEASSATSAGAAEVGDGEEITEGVPAEEPAEELYFLIRDLHPNTVKVMLRAGWRKVGTKLVPASV